MPLMNLAITTSGAKLSTNLPSTVSPSRLLQASTFLTAGDTQYYMSPSQAIQIGPTFTLSMYMLFAGHLRPQDEEGIREATWKEVMHKARLKLRRVPMDWATKPGTKTRKSQILAEAKADEYAYQLLIIEDLDDGRVHTFEGIETQPHSFEGISKAGIREILPIHQISKIFYADTGRILNISTEGESNNPVLLLKRDINAVPPRRMMEREEADYVYAQEESVQEGDEVDEVQAQLDAQLNEANTPSIDPSLHEDSIPNAWRLPQGLDPEWIAFEVYNEDEDSDTESEVEIPSTPSKTDPTIDPLKMANLSLDHHETSSSSSTSRQQHGLSQHPVSEHRNTTTVSNPIFNNIRTSLSLLETLLRLMSLQQFQQQSHLAITDELLNFFLEESSTTGAGGDEQHRQRLRAEARRKVGWDPYDESPVKRRGEDYQYGWAPGETPAGYRESSEYYSSDYQSFSPGEGAMGFHLRSREATPETPLQGRRSPSVMSDRRRLNVPRGSGGYEAFRRGSPLSRRSPAVPVEDDEADKGGSDAAQ